MSIVTEAMIVNLQIGLWQGYRLDKAASRDVTERNNASDDSARVNKHLVPKEALKDIITASGAIRTHFYAKTLPWKDNGDRLLTRKLYMPFMQAHGELREKFTQAVEDFLVRIYPAVRDQAEFRMGSLFDINDYPEVSQLRHKFYANIDIDAVTEAGDFRVALDQHALQEARTGIEEAMQARLGKAMRSVWERLDATLGHFAQKMDSDGVFREATLKNLEELVEMLPALNILNDPNLDQITEEISSKLIGYDAKDLRKNPQTRTALAVEANEIYSTMAGFMNAFTGATNVE